MSAAFRVLVADAISLDGLVPLRDDSRFELHQDHAGIALTRE